MRTKTAFQVFIILAFVSVWIYAWLLWKHSLVFYAAWSLAGIFVLSHVAFLTAASIKNNGIADIAWGLHFVIITHIVFWLKLVRESIAWIQIIVLIMVTLWGLRLAVYIFLRNRGKSEDFRYMAMRKTFGDRPLINGYIRIFIMQGLWAFLISAPVLMILGLKQTGPIWFYWAGIVVWLIGFLFEVIADAQLSHFIRKQKKYSGHVIRSGLWKYSRHPNYFGEAMMWWGIFIIALTVENGWLSFFGPFMINFLLVYVSGVPLIEKKYKNYPDFIEYKKHTSRFIPWFPR